MDPYNRSHSLTSALSLEEPFSGTLDDNMSFPSAHVLAEENRKLKKENEELRNSMAEKNAGLLGMQRRYNHLESKLETMECPPTPPSSAMNNKAETKFDSEVETLRAEDGTLREKLDEMTLKEAHLQSAFQDAKQKSETLAEEKATLTEENQKLAAELASALKVTEKWRIQVKESTYEVIRRKKEAVTIEANLREAKLKIRELSDTNATYAAEIAELKTKGQTASQRGRRK